MNKKEQVELIRKRSRAFFERRWAEIEKIIEYDVNWQTALKPEQIKRMRELGNIEYNLRDMFNDPQFLTMKPGDVAKTMDDFGRKFIFVQTRLGIFSLFVTSKDVSVGRLGDLRTTKMAFYNSDALEYSRANLATWVGSPNGLDDNKKDFRAMNIGQRLEKVVEMLLDPTKPCPNTFQLEPKEEEPK